MYEGSKKYHSQRLCRVILVIISGVMLLSASHGQEPEQSLNLTLNQKQPNDSKEPGKWCVTEHPWIGLAIRISEDTLNNTFQMDSLIHIIHFDTTELTLNDPTSLYRAISHVRLKPLNKTARENGDYGFKTTDDSFDIQFRINKPDFVKFLIDNNINRFSFHKSRRKFKSVKSKTSSGSESVILCKLVIDLPEYSEQDRLIRELESKEYIFDVSIRKWQDLHTDFTRLK
jgi:hypothetical protein